MTEIDHEGTSKMVCPYCGREQPDLLDIDDDDGVTIEVDCVECDQMFNYTYSADHMFTTSRIDRKER